MAKSNGFGKVKSFEDWTIKRNETSRPEGRSTTIIVALLVVRMV